MTHAPLLIIGNDLPRQQVALARFERQCGALDRINTTQLQAGGFPDFLTSDLFGTPQPVALLQIEAASSEVQGKIKDTVQSSSRARSLALTSLQPSKAKKLVSAVRPYCDVIDVTPPPPWDRRRWRKVAHELLEEFGFQPDREAYDTLWEAAGPNSTYIAAIARSLATYGYHSTISAQDIQAVAPQRQGAHGAFALIDEIHSGNVAKVTRRLEAELGGPGGSDPLALHGALLHHYRALLLLKGGQDPREAGVKVSEKQLPRLTRIAEQYDMEWLAQAYQSLLSLGLTLRGEHKVDDPGRHTAQVVAALSLRQPELLP